MHFQILKKQVYRTREKEPRYLITPSGRIRFNPLAVNEVLLPAIKSAEKVMLGYSKETNAIAVFPVSPEALAADRTIIAFKVVTVAGGKRRSIPAKPFFDRLELDLPAKGFQGTPVLENDENYGPCVVLSIVKGSEVAGEDGGRRKGKK